MDMKIILDTNFLVYCAKEKLDYKEKISNMINEDYELVVPNKVIEELKMITKKTKTKIPISKRKPKFKKTTGRDKEAADLALQLVEKNNITKLPTVGDSVDNSIINLAKENPKNIVCTLDRELRKVLGRVILINKGKKLMLTR